MDGSVPAADDARAALEVVTRFQESLDAGDVEAAAALCLPELVFLGSGLGEECNGRDALGPMFASLREQIADVFLGWELHLTTPAVSVHADTALVTATGDATLTLTSGVRRSRYVLTSVVHRTSDGWRVWSFHGSEPQPW